MEGNAMSIHTYFRKLVHNGNDVRGLAITVFSADNNGNYVEKNETAFSRHEALWCLRGDSMVHKRDGDEYQNCMSSEEAYTVAVNSIMEYFGSEYVVGG
jgi:hypothetical protein